MIVVLSVMKGFENEFQRTLLGFEPHLMLLDPDLTQSGADGKTYHEVSAALKSVPGIVSQSPFVAGHVIIQLGEEVQNPIMKAILPDDPQLESLKEQDMVIAGELDLEPRVEGVEVDPSLQCDKYDRFERFIDIIQRVVKEFRIQ